MEIKLKERTEKERVAYLIGKYFTDELTLEMLKLQLGAIPSQKLKGMCEFPNSPLTLGE